MGYFFRSSISFDSSANMIPGSPFPFYLKNLVVALIFKQRIISFDSGFCLLKGG